MRGAPTDTTTSGGGCTSRRAPRRDLEPFVEMLPDRAESQLMTAFVGTCVLAAYDHWRPCLYVNRAGYIDLGQTYLQIAKNPFNEQPTGAYRYAIEIVGGMNFEHRGMLEGPSVLRDGKPVPAFGYLRVVASLDQADVRVLLSCPDAMGGGSPAAAYTDAPVPPLEAYPAEPDWPSGVFNSSLDIRYNPAELRLAGPVVRLTPGKSERAGLVNTRLTCTCAGEALAFLDPFLEARSSNVTLYDYRQDRQRLANGPLADVLKNDLQ